MFFKKIFLSFTIILLAVSCRSIKSSNFGYSESDELAENVPNYVLFTVNTARLDSEARNMLDVQSEWLRENSDINVIIEGHCDERGTREYNLALGAKRANSVRSYLISSGINPSRISTISYGKERPVVEGTGSDVWRENRRAVTVIN
ncbi:MAG: peptidoglycan-associated lipoprotein Pal [Rickettsiales bacterium]|nr:peptidoglycan-associated lipoprotein Pal [Rickettsiales bacterium]